MTDQFETELREALETFTDNRSRENFQRLIGEMEMDASVIVTLKGHLLLEERLTSAIEKFVFHPEHLDARFTFFHKLSLARSMSTDEHKNGMWDVILKINSLRNALAHRLDEGSREKAVAGLRETYIREIGELEDFEKEHEHWMILGAVAASLGFVGAFEQEVERFKGWVKTLDRVVNPHRNTPKGNMEQP